MICLVLAGSIFLADFLCKNYVIKNRKCGEVKSVCEGRVLLKHVRNYGFAMNMLERYPKLIRRGAAMTCIFAAGLCAYISRRPGRRLEKLGLACILGGGLNNLYDRIRRGYVVDYVSFKSPWKKFTDTVFNISDFFILAGSILYSAGYLFRKK